MLAKFLLPPLFRDTQFLLPLPIRFLALSIRSLFLLPLLELRREQFMDCLAHLSLPALPGFLQFRDLFHPPGQFAR